MAAIDGEVMTHDRDRFYAKTRKTCSAIEIIVLKSTIQRRTATTFQVQSFINSTVIASNDT